MQSVSCFLIVTSWGCDVSDTDLGSAGLPRQEGELAMSFVLRLAN